jgi:LysM repeat protein
MAGVVVVVMAAAVVAIILLRSPATPAKPVPDVAAAGQPGGAGSPAVDPKAGAGGAGGAGASAGGAGAGAGGAGAGDAAGQGRAAQTPGGPGAAPAAPAGPGEAAADDGLALADSGKVFQAQTRLSEALRAGIEGPKGKAVRERLAALADRSQLSGQVVPEDPYSKTYQVAGGDAVAKIGRRFLIPAELVVKLNQLASANVIREGQTLKVIQGPVNIEIYKGRHELQAWLDQVCLRTYPIAIGASNKTPDGTFVVKSKMKNPPYQPQHKSPSEFKAAGAPDNPLGTRWIDIGNHYGIHGTIDPTSIGREVSEGCIRMHNKDVEELYDMVVAGGSKVTIRP